MTRAATVVLLRDTELGPEVLLLRRPPSTRAFPVTERAWRLRPARGAVADAVNVC